MNAEKITKESSASRTLQQRSGSSAMQLQDNRDTAVMQSDLSQAIQRMEDDEEDLMQGKFETAQRLEGDEDEELMQGKFETVQQKESPNTTGIPDDVKGKMEESFGTDFSDVRVHADSAKAPEVGALAYTQGTDIHFAPGQFKPDTSAGQQLLGHELTHVIQQAEGRVQPTTEINGMAVNDSEALESEADRLGQKAASR